MIGIMHINQPQTAKESMTVLWVAIVTIAREITIMLCFSFNQFRLDDLKIICKDEYLFIK